MYYPDFPYYQQYYYFNNYMPKYGYNAAFGHPPAVSPPQTAVGIPKQSLRKSKEAAAFQGIGAAASNSLVPTSSAQSSCYSNGLERQESNKESEAYKQQIIQWLKSLQMDERFEVFMIREKWFAQTIIKMFWKQKTAGDSTFALYSEEDKKERNNGRIVELDQQFYCRKCGEHDSLSNATRREGEQELIRVLRILDTADIYDCLVFDRKFLEDIDHVVEIFDLISDSNIFATPHFQQWSWFNQNSFQSIASWIVSQFERIIQFRFLEDRHKFNHKQSKLLAEESNQGTNNKDNNSSNSQESKSGNAAVGSSSDSPTQLNNQSAISNNANKNSSSSMMSSSNGDSCEIKEDSVSTQENLCHFQNILAFWGSLNASKKKKILNKSVEMHRKLLQNSQIEGAEKHDRPLEWYKKKREIFYSKCKPPNDEEIQQYFSQFSEESQATRFMETMCFTTLEDTTSIMTVVLKKMHDAINEMYAEQIEADLIFNDELERNSKKKKNQKTAQNSNNNNSSSLKKKKLQNASSQSRSQLKSPASNIKNNGSSNALSIAKKEKTFAEEVNLLHQANQLLENTGKQRSQNEQIHHGNGKIKGENSSQMQIENNSPEEQLEQRAPPMQSLKQEAIEICCMQNKCEMLEISKAIAARLISNCIQGLDRNLNDNEDGNSVEESVGSPKSVRSSTQSKQQEKQQQQLQMPSQQTQRKKKKKREQQQQQQQLSQFEQQSHLKKPQQISQPSDDAQMLGMQKIHRSCNVHAVSCGEETDEVTGIKEAESSDFSDDNHTGQPHKSNRHKKNHATVDDSQEGGSTQTMACSCDYYTTKKSPLTPPAFSDEEQQLNPFVDQHSKQVIGEKKIHQRNSINNSIKSTQQQQSVDIHNTFEVLNTHLAVGNAESEVALTGQVNHGHDDFIQVAIKKKKDIVKSQDKGKSNNKLNNNNNNSNTNSSNNNNGKNRNNNQKSKSVTQNISETTSTQQQSQTQEVPKKTLGNNNKKQTNGNTNQNIQNKANNNDTKQHKSMTLVVVDTKESAHKLKKTISTGLPAQTATQDISKKEDCSIKINDSNTTAAPFTVSVTNNKKIIFNDTFPAINTIDIHRDTYEEDNSSVGGTKQSSNGQIQLTKSKSVQISPSIADMVADTSNHNQKQKQVAEITIKDGSVLLSKNGICIKTDKENGNIFDKDKGQQSPKTPPPFIPQLVDAVSTEKLSKETESSKLTPVKNLKQRLLKQSPLVIQSHGFIPSNYPETKEYSYNIVPFNNSEPTKAQSSVQVSQDQTLELNQGQEKQVQKQQKGNSNSGRKKSTALPENARKQSGNGTNNSHTNNQTQGMAANQWKEETHISSSTSTNTPNGANGNPSNQSSSNNVPSVPTISQMNKARSRLAKKLFRKKITADIIDFTDLVNAESFRYQPSRYIIFLRIQYILKKIYGHYEEQVDLRIFGSCATGLSLPTSDIDLGVTGFETHPRSDLIYVLTNLANILEKLPWVKSIERIFTANIPIIKMEVDPLLDFGVGQEGIDDLSPADYAMLNMQPDDKSRNLAGSSLLKVDITVECQMQSTNSEILNHMGFLSTDFVVRWMSYYARLQPMTIVMKCFLHARNLNTNFKGGISSYCLLILIIAFFRDNQNIAQSEDYSNILLSFLKLYGTQFNPEITGISLSNGNPFFCTTRNGSQSKLQVVDPLTGKIMTQNTYLIDEILKEFSGFYTKINEFQKTIDKYLEKYTFSQLERLEKLEFSEQIKELATLLSGNQIQNIITNVECTKTSSNNNNHNSTSKDNDHHHKNNNNNNSNGLNNLMELSLHSTSSANQTSKRHKNHHSNNGNALKKAMSQQQLQETQEMSQQQQEKQQYQQQQQHPLQLFELKQQQSPQIQQTNQINQQQQQNQIITEGISSP